LKRTLSVTMAASSADRTEEKGAVLFEILDANKSGTLDLNEFVIFVKGIAGDFSDSATEKLAESVLAMIDSNKDGKVDKVEWQKMLAEWDRPNKEEIIDMLISQTKAKQESKLSKVKQEKLKALFNKLDTKKTGKLGLSELSALAQAINKDIAVNLLAALGKTEDDLVSEADWLSGMEVYAAMPDEVFLYKFDEYLKVIEESNEIATPTLSKAEAKAVVQNFVESAGSQYRFCIQAIEGNNFVVTFSKPSKHFPVPKFHIETVFVVNEHGLHFYVEDEEQARFPAKMEVKWSDKWLDRYIVKKMMYAKLSSTKAVMQDEWIESRMPSQKWEDDPEEAS